MPNDFHAPKVLILDYESHFPLFHTAPVLRQEHADTWWLVGCEHREKIRSLEESRLANRE